MWLGRRRRGRRGRGRRRDLERDAGLEHVDRVVGERDQAVELLAHARIGDAALSRRGRLIDRDRQELLGLVEAAPLDLAGGLLRPDQDHAEAAAALGDVEQGLLHRALALGRSVLVQLVEDHQQHLGGLTGPLLLLERATQGDTYHEALGPIVEVVDVHDGHLGLETDLVLLG